MLNLLIGPIANLAGTWLDGKVEKTKAEAQALVTAEVTAAQTAWDALTEAEQDMNPRPTDITLP